MSSKAQNLAVLKANGFRVPSGFVLGAEHYRSTVLPECERLAGLISDATAIRGHIDALTLPCEVLDAIEAGLEGLPRVARFAVRSSATVVSGGREIGEDGQDVSLAGQFSTVLAVPRNLVGQAVKRCWASLFNDRSACRFHLDASYVAHSAMAVVVQEFVEAKSCVVGMTVDPQGDGEVGALECSWGACEAIVSGSVTPDEITFDRRTGEIIRHRVGAKEHRVDHVAFDGNDDNQRKISTTVAEQRALALDVATIRSFIASSARIEALFGCPQDIEAVTDYAGEIVFTQARPVTTLPPRITPFQIATDRRMA